MFLQEMRANAQIDDNKFINDLPSKWHPNNESMSEPYVPRYIYIHRPSDASIFLLLLFVNKK